MKKVILILIILLITFFSIKELKTEKNWVKVRLIKTKRKKLKSINWKNIRKGDILVQEADGGFLGWFGHIAVVVDQTKTIEIAKLGERVYYRDINDWKKMRKVALLRLKESNDRFYINLDKEIDKVYNKPYMILNKTYSKGFYCSQLVWYLYNRSEDNIDIDGNGGILVMPWDIMKSDKLYLVDISSKEEKR